MRRPLMFSSLLLLGLVCLSAQPRTFPLVEMSKEDSARAQAVHDQLAQSKKDWERVLSVMWHKYAPGPGDFGNGGFSDDYRFLVGGEDPADILELSKEDTTKLIAAKDAFENAQKEAELFKKHILMTYVAARPGEQVALTSDGISVPQSRRKFLIFRYTKDYRFIVGLFQ